MKTAFVLSGGGAAGAYQFGAMKAVIKEFGITPDFIAANSAGALNAAGLSFGSLEELEEVWMSVNTVADVFQFKPFSIGTILLGSKSFFTNKPLRKKLSSFIEGRTPKIPFTVNYVDLRTELLYRSIIEDGSEKSISKIVASTSIPFIVDPEQGYMVDGGVVENTPLKSAIDWGAERIIVFLTKPRYSETAYLGYPKNSIEIATRVSKMIYNEAMINDMKICERYNRRGIGRYIDLHYFDPAKGTIDMFDFNKKSIEQAIYQGYTETLNAGFGPDSSRFKLT